MIDLIPLAGYLIALGALMWLHYKKITVLEERVEHQQHLITALALAMHMHLDGRDVSMHMIPIRTDEEELP